MQRRWVSVNRPSHLQRLPAQADALVPSATPKVLLDATHQSHELMQSALAAVKRESGRVSQPPEDDDEFHGEPMDARMAAAIVNGTQAASGELADRTESLLRDVERLTSYVNEPKLELLRATMTLRSQARRFRTVDDQESATDARMALECASAATRMLLWASKLVQMLTTVHGHAVVYTRAEIDKEQATSEEQQENLRRLLKEIEDIRYTVSPSQLGL